jgi:hypothetical protein
MKKGITLTMDELMNVKWTGDRERDEALREMIKACVDVVLICPQVAESCKHENDERLTMTADILLGCAEVCRDKVKVLSGGDSQDPATLRAAVKTCAFETEFAGYESRRYVPEDYDLSPKPSAEGLSRTIIRDLDICTHVLIDCWTSGEEFFRVWFNEELEELLRTQMPRQ